MSVQQVLATHCSRCSRPVGACGPVDGYATCVTCARAIREQVAAALPRLHRDCDALGAFHA